MRRNARHTIKAIPMLISVVPQVSSSMVPRHFFQRTKRVGSNCSMTGSGIWQVVSAGGIEEGASCKHYLLKTMILTLRKQRLITRQASADDTRRRRHVEKPMDHRATQSALTHGVPKGFLARTLVLNVDMMCQEKLAGQRESNPGISCSRETNQTLSHLDNVFRAYVTVLQRPYRIQWVHAFLEC